MINITRESTGNSRGSIAVCAKIGIPSAQKDDLDLIYIECLGFGIDIRNNQN